jgi:hypothetical protein
MFMILLHRQAIGVPSEGRGNGSLVLVALFETLRSSMGKDVREPKKGAGYTVVRCRAIFTHKQYIKRISAN